MKVSKKLLQTMFREFWALNNELCENVTILFLRKLDLTDDEIKEILDINENIKSRNFKDAEISLHETIEDTEHYY